MVKVKNATASEEQEFRALFEGVSGVAVRGRVRKPHLLGVQTTSDVLLDVLTYNEDYEKDESQRKPIYGCVVLDISGSMNGPPLQFCKEALSQLADALLPGDQIDLVTYGSQAQVVFQNCTVDNRSTFKAAVREITTNGMTNMEAGLDTGLSLVRKRNNPQLAPQIFLFSDGKVNQGVRGSQLTNKIQEVYANPNGDNVTVHALGIGESYDEKLMRDVARAGNNGVFFNIASMDAIPEAVEKCFAGVTRLVGRNAVLKIRGLGHAVVQCGMFGAAKDDITKGINVGALRHMGLIRKAVQVQVSIPSGAQDWVQVGESGETSTPSVPFLECVIEYQDPNTGDKVETVPYTINIGVTESHDAAQVEDETVKAFWDIKMMEAEQAEIYKDLEAGRVDAAKAKKARFNSLANYYAEESKQCPTIAHQARRFAKIKVDSSAKSKKAVWATSHQDEDDCDEDLGYGLFA